MPPRGVVPGAYSIPRRKHRSSKRNVGSSVIQNKVDIASHLHVEVDVPEKGKHHYYIEMYNPHELNMDSTKNRHLYVFFDLKEVGIFPE